MLQSISQSVSQSINQSINHLFTASAYHPMKKQACSKYVHVNITFTKKREYKDESVSYTCVESTKAIQVMY